MNLVIASLPLMAALLVDLPTIFGAARAASNWLRRRLGARQRLDHPSGDHDA